MGSAARSEIGYRRNNGKALKDAILGGLGIGRLPSFLAGHEIASGKLVRLRHTGPGAARNLSGQAPPADQGARPHRLFCRAHGRQPAAMGQRRGVALILPVKAAAAACIWSQCPPRRPRSSASCCPVARDQTIKLISTVFAKGNAPWGKDRNAVPGVKATAPSASKTAISPRPPLPSCRP